MLRPHYQVILQELKDRFAKEPDGLDAWQQKIAEQARQRFIVFLDGAPSLSIEDVLVCLEQKWRTDGLLGRPEEPAFKSF